MSTGRVDFVPTGGPWWSVAGKTVPPETITAELVDGEISVEIPTTDDPSVRPAGGTWTVREKVNGIARTPYAITVPAGDVPLRLADIAPVSPVGAVERVVRSVGGIQPNETGDVEIPELSGGGTVESVDGRTGAVSLGDLYVDPTELATALATRAALAHTHSIADVVGLASALGAKADTAVLAAVAISGSYADLTGTVPTAALPPLAVNETSVVASQAAMLALPAQRGDMAIRTDTGRTYVLAADNPATLANWKEVLAAGQVQSVAGQSGVVVLSRADVGLANVDNTADTAKPISTATQAALDGKAATSHNHAVADVTGLQTSLNAKATKLVVRQAWITSGDVSPLPNTSGTWQILTGFELSIPAQAGDYVELAVNALRLDSTGNSWMDQGVVVGTSVVRYLSSGSATPGFEGDPGWTRGSGYASKSAPRGFTVTSGDLDNGAVRFCLAVKSNGTGTLNASTNYPFYWRARNFGSVA
ncbi:hypothetical protein [Kibdelosporangium phytohabitans]|uniref:hypothetical protein n=1 Tax=Kibdelosporangium phytohabitans TaxID=860235 RepID=UPI001470329C|nr:hypothetical protein [Kibdelosporangium phytohabitans]MBE1471374.1 hypothetical protein [Kibdelosporangium phytohabitans]